MVVGLELESGIREELPGLKVDAKDTEATVATLSVDAMLATDEVTSDVIGVDCDLMTWKDPNKTSVNNRQHSIYEVIIFLLWSGANSPDRNRGRN